MPPSTSRMNMHPDSEAGQYIELELPSPAVNDAIVAALSPKEEVFPFTEITVAGREERANNGTAQGISTLIKTMVSVAKAPRDPEDGRSVNDRLIEYISLQLNALQELSANDISTAAVKSFTANSHTAETGLLAMRHNSRNYDNWPYCERVNPQGMRSMLALTNLYASILGTKKAVPEGEYPETIRSRLIAAITPTSRRLNGLDHMAELEPGEASDVVTASLHRILHFMDTLTPHLAQVSGVYSGNPRSADRLVKTLIAMNKEIDSEAGADSDKLQRLLRAKRQLSNDVWRSIHDKLTDDSISNPLGYEYEVLIAIITNTTRCLSIVDQSVLNGGTNGDTAEVKADQSSNTATQEAPSAIENRVTGLEERRQATTEELEMVEAALTELLTGKNRASEVLDRCDDVEITHQLYNGWLLVTEDYTGKVKAMRHDYKTACRLIVTAAEIAMQADEERAELLAEAISRQDLALRSLVEMGVRGLGNSIAEIGAHEAIDAILIDIEHHWPNYETPDQLGASTYDIRGVLQTILSEAR